MSLSVKHLALAYGQKQVLSDVSFELQAGEIACLLGQSGCGKTSALRCMAGFETPTQGDIHLNGKVLFSHTPSQSVSVPAHLRGIGVVFQNYALFPHLTVADNVGFGLHQLSKADRQTRIAELLDFIGLDTYHNRYPHELSGGQQQRVALARALAPKPQLILLDEPFSSLDAELRTSLAKEVRELLKQQDTQAIMVTHDQQEAFAMADKVGLIADGVLQQWATPSELYHQPKTQIVAQFIGQGSWLNATPISGNDASTSYQTVLGKLGSQYPYFTDTEQNKIEQNRTEQTGKLLLRPEMLEVVNIADDVAHHAHTTTATVVDTEFKGAYHLCQLKLGNQEMVYAHIVATADGSWPIPQMGDKVGVKVLSS